MTRILYLEDEDNIRDVTQEYLLMKQYHVDGAATGSQALELLKQHVYDMVILDIMVPDVSGLDVLQYVTTHFPDTATIMLTALGDEKHQVQAFNLKADDYMIKPFSPLLLLKRIEAILRRSRNAVYERGLVCKPESYQVFYDQRSLNLTVTEFLLFEALYSQPKRVFTREQLLHRIAPDDFMVNDRVVDAHIKNLRKKLPFPRIRTVIGAGYQYSEVDDETLS